MYLPQLIYKVLITTFYNFILFLLFYYYYFVTTGKNHIEWYGPRALLIVTEPELIKEILNNKDRSYPKAEMQPYVKKLLGDGLVSTESDKWGKLRKLADYAFHGDSLKVSFLLFIYFSFNTFTILLLILSSCAILVFFSLKSDQIFMKKFSSNSV